MDTQTQTQIEVTLKNIFQHLVDKGVVEPLVPIDNIGNVERVILMPITNADEFRAWRQMMVTYQGGAVSKIITTEVSKRAYVLNLNKTNRLLNIHSILPDGSGELLYKFSIKQDGDMVTILGNEIANSHLRMQHHLSTTK